MGIKKIRKQIFNRKGDIDDHILLISIVFYFSGMMTNHNNYVVNGIGVLFIVLIVVYSALFMSEIRWKDR